MGIDDDRDRAVVNVINLILWEDLVYVLDLISVMSAVAEQQKTAGTLFSIPVSNYSARCKYVILKKGLNIAVEVPEGGIKSESYMTKFNPLGLVPSLATPDGSTIIESEVINEYLVEKYASVGPSFMPATPEDRAKVRMISRLHDVHLGPAQRAMYKPMDHPEDRLAGIEKMHQLFDMLEEHCEAGPYMVGKDVSLADATVYGSTPFYIFMLPRFFGWDFRDNRPKLTKWFEYISKECDAAKVVYDEIWAALEAWEADGRWEQLGVPRSTSFHE